MVILNSNILISLIKNIIFLYFRKIERNNVKAYTKKLIEHKKYISNIAL